MILKVKTFDYFKVINNQVVLGKEFTKIPSFLFSKILDLFIYYSQQSKELYLDINYDKMNNYVITLPKQKIGVGTAEKETEITTYDINTLEKVYISSLRNLGVIHSHHYMEATFSPQDDKSDRERPPSLQLLFGNYPNIKLKASVFTDKRYYLPINQVVEYNSTHKYKAPSPQLKKILREQVYG